MTLASHRKGLMTLLAFVIALLALLALGRGHRLPDDGQHLRMNRLHAFERASVPSCAALADSTIALYIEGMDTGLRGAGCSDAPGQRPSVPVDFRHVRGQVLSEQQDHAVWSVVLGRPLETIETPRSLRYQLKRIAPDGKSEFLEPPDATVDLVIFDWWAPAAALLVLLVWVALIYLGATSAIVRDTAPAGTPLHRRSFSLAKVQMAWWFAIVFASFILLWLVTGETPALSGQALSLLGLSSVTTVAAGGINGTRTNTDGRSGVFFRELLSDGDGIAIQRFQMLVMTVTLGLVFLFQVARHLTMPEFDPSLLTVMGISAATYVGMKIPEQAKAETDAPAPGGKSTPGSAGGDASGAANGDPSADPKSGYTPESTPLKAISPDQAVAHGAASPSFLPSSSTSPRVSR